MEQELGERRPSGGSGSLKEPFAEVIGFAEGSMPVGSAGGQQAAPVAELDQLILESEGVHGMEDFDSVKTGIGEFLAEVFPPGREDRMCDRDEPAGFVDDANRVVGRNGFMRDVARFALAEESFKRRINIGDDPSSHQGLGHVDAARR